ncbi:MAG: response regulator, partial [Candidatus Omnitrophica bacterium]|nr:response regulator [Candidatus Omnitrophota bacterium]
QKDLPDLIILDVMMPKVNGYTVCSVLKNTEPYRSIPIIILTARSSEADGQFDPKFKPEAFITKPFHSPDLFTKVKELVS